MNSRRVRMEIPNANFHRYYNSIFVVVKKEIFRVFFWLYKGRPKYVGDYLKTTPRGMRRLGAMEREALEKKHLPATFDITFLYSLLQHTCGLAEDTAAIWNKPTTPEEQKSLEHTLFLLKKKRNALSHDPQPLMQMTKEDLDKKLSELKQLCSLIMHEAGQKANRASDEVNRCVNAMEKALDDIKTMPTPSGYTPGKFALLARQEMKGKHLHPSASTNTFVMPLIHMKGETGRHEAPLKLLPLWRCEDGSLPTTTILQGETGTGKTSICQYIFNSWVSCNNEIDDLQDFDLVVPVQCCKVFTRDLVEFLKEFLADTISLCGREDTAEFLRSLRILWLIDGFEEATVDARELLKKIEERGTSSNLIFITTKPQRCQDLVKFLTSKDNLCEVSLSGLNDEGIDLLIQKVLQEKEKDLNKCKKNKIKFLKQVAALGDEILMELKTPLKLTLILKLWQEGKLSKESGASLSLLYNEIMESHSKNLIKTLMGKSPLSEDILTEKINKWTQLLCKVAFDMFMKNKFVNIDGRSQNILKEGCENLFVSSDDWLSIFLQFESKDEGNSSYSFIHSSQQLYLAARHVCLLMKQKPNPDKLLKRLFKQKISLNEINHTHFYMMLLHVVSNVALQQTKDQPAAKILIELLSMCNDFDAFEVVQCAAYSQVIVKEVSKFIPQQWIVVDHTIKAAMALLEFKTPLGITLNIDNDPKDVKELINFVTKISRSNVVFVFQLRYHYRINCNESSDRYLEPICSSDAKCSLLIFGGKLTVDGCQFLTKMSKVRALALRVSSNEVLDKILCNLKYMSHLDSIRLSLKMPVLKVPISSYEYYVREFSIHLPVINDIHLDEAASALSQINQHYTEIHIYDIPASDAIRFILKLENKNIKVDSIIRNIESFSYGSSGAFKINYGPVPLTSPVSEFYDKWKYTYVNKSENEMGVKEVSLRTNGIPSCNIEYFENTGESSIINIPLQK